MPAEQCDGSDRVKGWQGLWNKAWPSGRRKMELSLNFYFGPWPQGTKASDFWSPVLGHFGRVVYCQSCRSTSERTVYPKERTKLWIEENIIRSVF